MEKTPSKFILWVKTWKIILEFSMFQFMVNGPQFYDVVVYMKNCGFASYHIFGGSSLPLDGALGQIDMAYLRENGISRKDHFYPKIE